jgi:hypothetical protein
MHNKRKHFCLKHSEVTDEETFGTGISDLIKTSYTIGSDMYINLID